MADELTPSQAAARVGATTRTVQRWMATGQLPARRVGGRWRVASDVLDAFVGSPAGTAVVKASAAETTIDLQRPGLRRISRLFIANRGEIARRIARTCQALGITPIAPTVEGPSATDLLDPVAVVEAARSGGADAVHPGYGFLAENPAFADAVEAAGMAWVGPPGSAIREMGDKASARRLATSLGVPVLPGYDAPDQSDERLVAAAQEIRVPLLVKPSAGGGGKGMRIVRDLETLADAMAAARREAKAAFGDERLILERYLDGPRHVEIQVLFDKLGQGVHLGERDCSIQRRHQKVLEESPSPAVSPELRDQMASAALSLAGAVGYVSAGTVEFLLDDRGNFYFLEMNTRLQVEHPVTELVAGRDLVADQIRIAAGEALGLAQEDVRFGGHAVEARLYAEDAENGFLPATGRLEAVRWPSGDGVRVDAGVDVGSEVTAQFDPMLAKLVAFGRDRGEAFSRLREALDQTVVLGLTTNVRFLRWLVREPALLTGQARVDTLERIWPPADWLERTKLTDAEWTAAAELLVDANDAGGDRHGRLDPWGGGWRLNSQPRIRLAAEDQERDVSIPDPREPSGTGGPAWVVADDTLHLDVAGLSVAFRLAPAPDVDRAARAAAAHGGTAAVDVVAPMPGVVLAVHVTPGAEVSAGDSIVTLEAMKMEHVVVAPGQGHVEEVAARTSDQVTRGQLLARIVP